MKKTPVISLLVSAALLGLCGCASDSAQKTSEPAQPKPAKPAKDTRPKEDRLKVGMTEEEVRTALGNPRGKSTNSDGSQTWMYNDAEKAMFVPYYSMSGGKIHSIVVVFDTTGKVKSWSSNESGRY